MGLVKSDLFTTRQNRLANYAKVLGHPARIAILEQLASRATCVCGDLVLEIGLAQPTISQHLKELKNAGLISGTISGTSVCYCIDAENWAELQKELGSFLHLKPFSNSSCCS